jgi:hypothetical protein
VTSIPSKLERPMKKSPVHLERTGQILSRNRGVECAVMPNSIALLAIAAPLRESRIAMSDLAQRYRR